MSRETTEARFDANRAQAAWKAHYQECPQCARGKRTRKRDDVCDAGYWLRMDHESAQRQLARNRKLDKQPSPDQAPLF